MGRMGKRWINQHLLVNPVHPENPVNPVQLAICRAHQRASVFVLRFMALDARARVFAAEGRASVMRAAVVATETTASAALAGR